jgi:hypothetical protein
MTNGGAPGECKTAPKLLFAGMIIAFIIGMIFIALALLNINDACNKMSETKETCDQGMVNYDTMSFFASLTSDEVKELMKTSIRQGAIGMFCMTISGFAAIAAAGSTAYCYSVK